MSMRRNIWQVAAATLTAAAMITVTSCATDEEAQSGENRYMGQPVAFTASAADYGGTETRATVDGTFDEGMSVAVKIGSETRQYTTVKNTDGTWKLQAATGVEPFYYDSPTAAVKAWAWGDNVYRNEEPADITVGESQDKESAYKSSDVVMAEKVVSPTDNALVFSHKTARVKVTLTKGMGITDNDLNDATVTLGIKQGDSDKNIKMYNAGNGNCYAMVAPVTGATPQLLINCGGRVFEYTLPTAQDFEANKQYAFSLKVKVSTIDLSKYPDGVTIEDDGNYTITGTGTKSVIVKGNAKITLKDVNFSGDKTAIHIKGGTPTIIIKGTNNSLTIKDEPGIWVDGENANVIITGDGSSTSCITIDSKTAIGTNGGWVQPECGNITIENVKIIANIKEAGAAAIGYGSAYGAGSKQKIGDITITNSMIEATLTENEWFPYGAVVGGCGGGEGTYAMGNIRITTTDASMTPQNYFKNCTCGNVLVGFPPSTYNPTVNKGKIYWNGVEQTDNITK